MLVALLPVALELPALATVAIVAAIHVALVGYEAIRFAEPRGAAAPAAAPRGRDGVAQPASRSTNQRARPRMRAAG